ncbi:FTR1 family iron permease [Rhodocyclus tenuis]|uniref:High-affinity iron transporter n=1 Tax=Rhodocyclus tenuis TaxID=1066 RepID=A0A840GA18_RHOTE|nr:FTR1 family protein [Rhodocyclus tenuis]MBB4248715.1 high-affinity iron transporter [Rhodocyclus tenuis]
MKTMSHLRSLACLLVLLGQLAFAGAAGAATDGAAVVAEISRRGDAAVAAYSPTKPLPTASEFSSLYFDVFEGAGMELDLGMKSPRLKTEIEVLFGSVNSQSMRGVPATELAASWNELRSKLAEAGTLYDEPQSTGFLAVFLKSLLILVREGVEAMLVVGALAAYLRRAGGADRVWVIYAGAGVAIPLSLLTGWALTGALQAAGASRSVLEGVTMLLAAAVLFYLSFWMFSKREAQRWQAWVAGKVDSALTQGSLLALAGAACLAVYREGAETVLFYGALLAGSAGQESAVAAGIAVAAAVLVGAFFVLRLVSLRLPFAAFFGGTAVLLYGLAVVFVGQGIVELQAAGLLGSSPLAWAPQVSSLGIAPTAQGIGAQGSMLLLPLLLWSGSQWRRARA